MRKKADGSKRKHKGRGHKRGSAAVFMIMMMSVLATGMVATTAMLSGVQTQSSSVILKRNAAFYAAEAGLQQAIWNMNNNPAWINSLPSTGTLANGCTYTVTALTTPNWPATPVTFQSVGTSPDGTVVSQAVITVTSTVLVPGLAIGANMADSGTLTVAGGVEVVGSVTRSGTMTQTNVAGLATSALEAMGSFSSSGTFTVPGNVLFNGSVNTSGNINTQGNVQAGGSVSHSGNWNVSGSTEQYDSPNLTIAAPTVDTASLISQANANGTVIAGPLNKSNLTIDFTKSPNQIVYVTGNVNLSGTTTVIGTGTLVVNGTISFSGSLGANNSPAPINIVSTGDVSMSGNLTITGCVCAGGNFSKSGSTTITGEVVVQSSLSGSGNIAITYAPPPWFIHFSGTTGGQNIQTTNFSGANY